VRPDPVDELLLAEGEEFAWELFHENSKMSVVERHPVFGAHPTDAMVIHMMNRLRRVKPYTDRAKVPLPADLPPSDRSLDEVMRGRESARDFTAEAIGLRQLAKVLSFGYGVTRSNEDNNYPRPFRAVPSGGALYPLELYVHAPRVDGLAPGLYHYDPEDETLDVLQIGDESEQVASFMVQVDLCRRAAATLLISAVFVRSIFKYGDRGYRFVLLEAGHLAQNMLLTAAAMGVAGVSIGGYVDRRADRYLEVDGLNESVVYVLHLGRTEDSGPHGDVASDRHRVNGR
jgi:SagB-type dehydrogenase family enzyme